MAIRTAEEWRDRPSLLLKAELTRRNIGYRELTEKLKNIGCHHTEKNIANKLSRGGFSMVFFYQCLMAIGCTHLHLSDD